MTSLAWSARTTATLLTMALASCAASRTCLHPSYGFKNQYLVEFPRNVVVRADDPRDESERHRQYAERLNNYFQSLPGAETCRTASFHYYQGGGIGAVADCDGNPPLKLRPGVYNQDGSAAYVACYPAE